MAKSYKKRGSSLIRSTSKNVKKAIPSVVKDNFKTAKYVAKGVAKETIPIVERGVSAVYGTIDSGFNLGVKEAKNVGKGIKNYTSRKFKKGGRRHRHSRRCKH